MKDWLKAERGLPTPKFMLRIRKPFTLDSRFLILFPTLWFPRCTWLWTTDKMAFKPSSLTLLPGPHLPPELSPHPHPHCRTGTETFLQMPPSPANSRSTLLPHTPLRKHGSWSVTLLKHQPGYFTILIKASQLLLGERPRPYLIWSLLPLQPVTNSHPKLHRTTHSS